MVYYQHLGWNSTKLGWIQRTWRRRRGRVQRTAGVRGQRRPLLAVSHKHTATHRMRRFNWLICNGRPACGGWRWWGHILPTSAVTASLVARSVVGRKFAHFSLGSTIKNSDKLQLSFGSLRRNEWRNGLDTSAQLNPTKTNTNLRKISNNKCRTFSQWKTFDSILSSVWHEHWTHPFGILVRAEKALAQSKARRLHNKGASDDKVTLCI